MERANAAKQHVVRRRWPLAEKRRIVELTLCEGASIRAIAREHDLDRNSLSHWRALYRAGKLDPQGRQTGSSASSATFLPVTIAPAMEWPTPNWRGGSGSVVLITLATGATVRIETGVLDAALVCALMAQVQR